MATVAGEQVLGSVKVSMTLYKTVFPASLLLYLANFMLASILTTVVTKSVLKVQAPLDVFQSLNTQFLFHSNNSEQADQGVLFISSCARSLRVEERSHPPQWQRRVPSLGSF